MMSLDEFLSEWRNDSQQILVHTSGSTGTPKPLWVEKRRMKASARITCDFLGLRPGNTALLCMPLDYIAGKMMVVRSLVRQLRLINVEPSGHPLADIGEPIDFAAMVPLQVFNSLQVAEERERLMRVRHLIIGGGAIDEQISRQLLDFPYAVWSTYGMTETLSHIALRRLSGHEASEWYTPFPSVSVSLSADGCLVIDAPEVNDSQLVTTDLAELRPDGRFRILGRKDNVICSGGVKIQIEQVEQLLRPHVNVPFLITKRSDLRLGECVVLLTECSPADSLRSVCQQVLPRYWQPCHYITVSRIPLTPTGKPSRHEAQLLAAST